jgi:hypothetical protein
VLLALVLLLLVMQVELPHQQQLLVRCQAVKGPVHLLHLPVLLVFALLYWQGFVVLVLVLLLQMCGLCVVLLADSA